MTDHDAVRAMMAADRASRALGIELVECGEDSAVTALTVRPDHLNGHGMAHGGVVFALADTAFACACNAEGPVTVAGSGDIVFVSPAHEGEQLMASASRRVQFGRQGLYDVSVRCGDRVVAEFRGRSHRLARPS